MENLLDNTSKVNILLEAWLRFLDLEELSQQLPQDQEARLDGISITGDRLCLAAPLFDEMQNSVRAGQRRQTDAIWVLSFPQIYQVEQGSQKFYPIFSVNITPILEKSYQAQGWNLKELQFMGAGKSLSVLLDLVDEQVTDLITKNGLRRFLSATFNSTFDTFETWMQQVNLPNCLEVEQYVKRSRQRGNPSYAICRQPFLFKFKGGATSFNLKEDFKQIKENLDRKWQNPGYPAYEFLFGQPTQPNHEVAYLGAFPTYPPVDSQLKALKHAQSEPITPVQGPPGSGKTTLTLHVIAQQIVKRALNLIETGNDCNNLTVISSTVYQAIDNVIDRVEEDFKTEFLHLRGGSRKAIEAPGHAAETIQAAISHLQKESFDEAQHRSLAQEIQMLKQRLVNHETDFLNLRQQRKVEVDLQARLRDQTQTLEQKITELNSSIAQYRRRSRDLAKYEHFSEALYQHLDQQLSAIQHALPNPNSSWLIRVWNWFRNRTETQLLKRLKQESQSLIAQTRNTPFEIKQPENRQSLIQQSNCIKEWLNQNHERQSVQTQLSEQVNLQSQKTAEHNRKRALCKI